MITVALYLSCHGFGPGKFRHSEQNIGTYIFYFTSIQPMEVISLAAAAIVTEWSERTFWRRFKDGVITREIRHGKAVVELRAIAAHACFPLDDDAVALLARADTGDACAQTELALLFLEHRKPKGALAWLTLAVKQDDANAMYLLGRAYITGEGADTDENLGLMWLAKAAFHRHPLASAVMHAMRARIMRRD